MSEPQFLACDAPKDCALCPRLFAFRQEVATQNPDWFNGPVPTFGDANAQLLIVGLAPGMKGANRTGRPFTGDYAGDLLYQVLGEAHATTGTYAHSIDDGLELHGVAITNAVRCLPPQNKPIGAEIKTCSQFLSATITHFTKAKTILALGRVAHESLLTTLGERRAAFPFAHGAQHQLAGGTTLFDSYHCSRYNTNTNRLTPDMFREVVFAALDFARANG